MASIVTVTLLTSNDMSQDRANELARNVRFAEQNAGVEVDTYAEAKVEHVEQHTLDRLDPAKRKAKRRKVRR